MCIIMLLRSQQESHPAMVAECHTLSLDLNTVRFDCVVLWDRKLMFYLFDTNISSFYVMQGSLNLSRCLQAFLKLNLKSSISSKPSHLIPHNCRLSWLTIYHVLHLLARLSPFAKMPKFQMRLSTAVKLVSKLLHKHPHVSDNRSLIYYSWLWFFGTAYHSLSDLT